MAPPVNLSGRPPDVSVHQGTMATYAVGSNYLYLSVLVVTARNSSCGKVMFLQACVKNSVHNGGVRQGGGACMVRGACMVK